MSDYTIVDSSSLVVGHINMASCDCKYLVHVGKDLNGNRIMYYPLKHTIKECAKNDKLLTSTPAPWWERPVKLGYLTEDCNKCSGDRCCTAIVQSFNNLLDGYQHISTNCNDCIHHQNGLPTPAPTPGKVVKCKIINILEDQVCMYIANPSDEKTLLDGNFLVIQKTETGAKDNIVITKKSVCIDGFKCCPEGPPAPSPAPKPPTSVTEVIKLNAFYKYSVKTKSYILMPGIDIYSDGIRDPILKNIRFDSGTTGELLIPDACFTGDLSTNYPIIGTSTDGWNNKGNLRTGLISLKSSTNSYITANMRIYAGKYTHGGSTIPCDNSGFYANFGVFSFNNSSNFLYQLIKYNNKYRFYEINVPKENLILRNYKPDNIYKIVSSPCGPYLGGGGACSKKGPNVFNPSDYPWNYLYVKIFYIKINDTLIYVEDIKEYDPNFSGLLDTGSYIAFWTLPDQIYDNINGKNVKQHTQWDTTCKMITGTIDIVFDSEWGGPKYTYTYKADKDPYKTVVFSSTNAKQVNQKYGYITPGINFGAPFFINNALHVEYIDDYGNFMDIPNIYLKSLQ